MERRGLAGDVALQEEGRIAWTKVPLRRPSSLFVRFQVSDHFMTGPFGGMLPSRVRVQKMCEVPTPAARLTVSVTTDL